MSRGRPREIAGARAVLCAAVVLLAACARRSLPSKPPPAAFASFLQSDLADGIWQIVPDAASTDTAAWPLYLVITCAKTEASDELDIVRGSPRSLFVPCGCFDRTLAEAARLGAGSFASRCSRSTQLVVIRWTDSARLVIRKRRDEGLIGELVSGDGEGKLLGRFTLRPFALNARNSRSARRGLRTLAGAGAVDCGRATDEPSAERVYACASAALARHQRFFCRYSPKPAYDIVPPATRTVWGLPAAYVGTAEGRVFVVDESPRGTASLGAVALDPASADRPRQLMPGMTIPQLVSLGRAQSDVDARVSGIAIVEALVGRDGSVREVQILKPLPYGADEVARRVVLGSTFAPSRFFGVPVAAVHNVALRASNGSIEPFRRDRRLE